MPKYAYAFRFGYPYSDGGKDLLYEIFEDGLGALAKTGEPHWYRLLDLPVDWEDAPEYIINLTTEEQLEIANKIIELSRKGEIEIPYRKAYIDNNYKYTPYEGDTVVIEFEGVNVNPRNASLNFAYDRSEGYLLYGEIVCENLWADGDIMRNFEIVDEFDPTDPESIIEFYERIKGDKEILDVFNDYYDIEKYRQEYERIKAEEEWLEI